MKKFKVCKSTSSVFSLKCITYLFFRHERMYIGRAKSPKVMADVACYDLGTGLFEEGRQQFKPSLRYTEISS